MRTLRLIPPPSALDARTDGVRREVREFVASWFVGRADRPRSDSWVAGWDPAFSRALAERGWVGMAIPTEHGGGGRSPLERHVVAEELLAAGAPVAFHWFADRQIAPALLRFGTEEQQRTYLPRIARGEISFALGLSEPEAGSDLASVRTTARRVAGGFELTGVKLWTSNAHRADAMSVLARTEEGADVARHAALSQFIVDLPDPSVTIRPVLQLGGVHHFNEVHFDGTFVPDERLLGSLGDGWKQVTAELAHERSGPERFLSTFPLLMAALELIDQELDHNGREDLGALYSRLWTLHHLSLTVAGALARGETPDVAAALVKDVGTVLEGTVIETVRRLTRRTPRTRDFDQHLAEAVRAAPGFTVRGGTNEILRGIVAREVLR